MSLPASEGKIKTLLQLAGARKHNHCPLERLCPARRLEFANGPTLFDLRSSVGPRAPASDQRVSDLSAVAWKAKEEAERKQWAQRRAPDKLSIATTRRPTAKAPYWKSRAQTYSRPSKDPSQPKMPRHGAPHRIHPLQIPKRPRLNPIPNQHKRHILPRMIRGGGRRIIPMIRANN